MQNTWPVSNKKFDAHDIDPQAHDVRFNAIEADYEAQIEAEKTRAGRVEQEIEARSLNRYNDVCGKITTEQTRAEFVETGLSDRITSEVDAIKQTITITKSFDTVELFNKSGSSVGSNTRYLRVHSDGYKEMWGVITMHSSTSNVVVMLPDSFSDVNYNISQINSGTYGAFTCDDLTNSSFTLAHAQSITPSFVIRWKATGY